MYFEIPSVATTTPTNIPIEQFKDFYPYNITSSTITSNSTHFLLFGGTNDSWDGNNNIIAINKLQLLNLKDTDNPQTLYSLVGHLPYPAYNMGLIRNGSISYLFGGFNNGTYYSSILKVDLSSYPYNITTVGHLPIGFELPEVIRVGDIVYIFGGNNPIEGTLQRHIFEFNMTSNAVTDTNIVIPYKQPVPYYFNNLIYLIGGQDVVSNLNVNKIYSFDLMTKEITEVGKLPGFTDIRVSQQFGDKILIFSQSNSTFITDQPSIFDLSTFKSINYHISYLTNDSLITNFLVLSDENNNVYYLGGLRPYSPILTHDIFHLNFNEVFGDQVINSDENFQNYNTVNNQSTFVLSKKTTTFNFGDKYSQLIMPITPTTLNNAGTISINLKYFSHQDVNTRQRILIGFTSSTPTAKVDTFNTVPSSNFIGIELRNDVANNNTNYIMISARIVKDKSNIIDMPFYYSTNQTHDISFLYTQLNSTSFYYSLTIDGNTYGQIGNSSLNNMVFNSFSIWNENASYGSLQGYFKGQINSYSFFTNIPVQSNQYIKNILIIALLSNLVIILLLIYVIRSPRYKYLVTGKSPDVVPNALVDLGIYNLYIKLRKAFEKLEQFSKVSIEEDHKDFENSLLGDFDFLKNADSILFDQETLEEMTGTGIKILIALLDYLDHGTYLTNIQLNLGLSRSSFYYTINKLKEQGFIEIRGTIQDDQRKKFVVISSKGYALLKLVYKHLDSYFNGNQI